MNQIEFDLTIDVLNSNNDKINKIDLSRPFEKIIIESNDVLSCSMVLEEYVTDKGQPLMFNDERCRCLGEIKIGFDRAFGAYSTWEVDYYRVPGNFQTVVTDGRTRTETDGVVIFGTSHALLTAGRNLKQVRFKEGITNEKFYAFIKYGFGIW